MYRKCSRTRYTIASQQQWAPIDWLWKRIGQNITILITAGLAPRTM